MALLGWRRPEMPSVAYNDNNQVTSIDGQEQTYRDLGNDLRLSAGNTRFVNSSLGVRSRTVGVGLTAVTTYYLRAPDGTILAAHDAQTTASYKTSARYYVTDRQGSVIMLPTPPASGSPTTAIPPTATPSLSPTPAGPPRTTHGATSAPTSNPTPAATTTSAPASTTTTPISHNPTPNPATYRTQAD